MKTKLAKKAPIAKPYGVFTSRYPIAHNETHAAATTIRKWTHPLKEIRKNERNGVTWKRRLRTGHKTEIKTKVTAADITNSIIPSYHSLCLVTTWITTQKEGN